MPAPVIFYRAPREFYREYLVAPDELYLSHYPVGERKNCLQVPTGPIDVAAIIKELPEPWNKPSLFMFLYASDSLSMVSNIAPLACPKVLMLGDTHHGKSPLTLAVEQAVAEPWDLVVSQFNQHHCHWFEEAGCRKVSYIPCFHISPIRMEVPEKRTRGVTMVGNFGCHPYRRWVVDELRRRGIQVETFSGVSREDAAKIYNESAVSLNISLNGDFNLRNYEIPAAGGYQVNESGGIGIIVARIKDALDNAELYIKWTANLCYGFWRENSPEAKIRALWETIEANPDPSPKVPANGVSERFWERLAIYEQAQELARLGKWRPADFAGLRGAWE